MNKENREIHLLLRKKVSWPSEAQRIINRDWGTEKTDHKVDLDIKIIMILDQGTPMKCLQRITILRSNLPG